MSSIHPAKGSPGVLGTLFTVGTPASLYFQAGFLLSPTLAPRKNVRGHRPHPTPPHPCPLGSFPLSSQHNLCLLISPVFLLWLHQGLGLGGGFRVQHRPCGNLMGGLGVTGTASPPPALSPILSPATERTPQRLCVGLGRGMMLEIIQPSVPSYSWYRSREPPHQGDTPAPSPLCYSSFLLPSWSLWRGGPHVCKDGACPRSQALCWRRAGSTAFTLLVEVILEDDLCCFLALPGPSIYKRGVWSVMWTLQSRNPE